MRVCLLVSARSEEMLLSKLLPTTVDHIDVVCRLSDPIDIEKQMSDISDRCDVVIYDPALDNGKALEQWPQERAAPVLCCWCSEPAHSIRCIVAGAVFVLFDTSTSTEIDVALRRCQRALRIARTDWPMIMHGPQSEYGPGMVALPHMKGIEVRSSETILHVEGQGNYTNVVFASEPRLVLSRTIGDYEDALRKSGFLRVHRSHIVNMRHVRRFVRGKVPYVVMSNGDKVAVSDKYRDRLMKALNLVKRR